MSTVFWDTTPSNKLKFSDILEKQTASIFRVKPNKQQALFLLSVWMFFNPEDGDTSENSTLLTDTPNNVNVPVWNVVMHALK